VELILSKLHCVEFSSEKVNNTLVMIRAELQSVEDELQSVTDQQDANKRCYQQLLKQREDAKESLHDEVIDCCLISISCVPGHPDLAVFPLTGEIRIRPVCF